MVEGSDLYGDGVNIAARLEGIADPGGVLVSGTTFDYVGHKVTAGFEDLGTHTLKNIAEPVRVYRIAGTPRLSVASTGTASDRPSVAVLPFTNMSGDPEQEYFADGMVEDIITALSHFKALFVIARKCFQRARRISTVDPGAFFFLTGEALALLLSGQYSDAAELARRSAATYDGWDTT
jgi:hypothetical protein